MSLRYELQEKPVTTKHPVLGEIKFQVEVPQCGDEDDCRTQCGGSEGLVTFTNSQIATNAKNAARAFARNYEVAEGTDPATFPSIIKQIEEKGQTIARDYSPAADTERGPSKARKAAVLDQIAALVNSGESFGEEDLKRLLAQVK